MVNDVSVVSPGEELPVPSSLLLERLAQRLDASQVTANLAVCRQYSQDYNWYSPILKEQLAEKTADLVVWPASNEELTDVLAMAYEERVPVTVRGGGTGNYGQCVPMQGGVVLDTSRLNRILDIGAGFARVQAGVRLGQLERAVNEVQQELCIYPSTFLTSSAAGFIGGGSGGIGSITHGMLWDGNVLSADIYPVNGQPRPETLAGDSLMDVIHAYGTTAVMSDVTLRLTEQVAWRQIVLTFPHLRGGAAFCDDLCADQSIDKRLVTLNAQAIVGYFNRTKKLFPDTGALVFVYVRVGQEETVRGLATRHGGQVDTILPEDSKMRLSDFTWNHTTLYGMKADPDITYLQSRFDPTRFDEQLAAIESVLGGTFMVHIEYLRDGGQLMPGMLPLLPYGGEANLRDTIAFLNEIGCSVANPHTYWLEDGGRSRDSDRLLARKRRFDPAMLLNPGKLRAAATTSSH